MDDSDWATRKRGRGKTHQGDGHQKCLTRTQPLFTAQMGLFKKKVVWIECIALEVMDSFGPSHDTPSALIHPGIQSSLPRSRKKRLGTSLQKLHFNHL